MSDYKVRPATLRDAKAVAEVHAAAAKAAYKDILPDDQLSALAPASREAKWREAIEYAEPQIIVAELDGEVIGFVGFDRSRDPKTPATTGEIWALHIKPEHGGKGVGVALWDADALAPVLGLDVQGPDLAGGGGRLGVARAVEADKADHGTVDLGHVDLRFGVLDGLAPLGLARGRCEQRQLVLGQDVRVGGLGGGGMNFGNGFGVAQGGGADFVVGHLRESIAREK